MAQKDPTATAQKWATNLSAAGPTIQAGVEAVTVAPGQAAARQAAVYVANVQASAPKWARNVAAVPLSTWQNDMVTKGLPRIASGAQAAQPKMVNFLTQFLPFVNSAAAALPARGTLEQNIARSAAMIRKTAEFTYRPQSG